ncbi:hypothetical protein CDAR_75111 [Caerostris darwini]|uniref:Uncharacterized protein n=1 Tax=Caerostris darwini TaxID=1538125 RepID=A0AAV4MUX0_9ARAC|nr:hypothetical protein CDAR_75111 [Caerostris darwini]
MTFFSPWRFERSSPDKRSFVHPLLPPWALKPHPSPKQARSPTLFRRNLRIVSNKEIFCFCLYLQEWCCILVFEGFKCFLRDVSFFIMNEIP